MLPAIVQWRRATPVRALRTTDHGLRTMQAIRDFYVARGVVVTGDVVLSAGVNLWYGTVIRGDLARITLGPRVNIQDGCVLHTDHGEPQDIEQGVVVGHRAVLHGRRIGRDTLIGMG